MEKIYYILGFAMLSLFISCEDSKSVYEQFFKEEEIESLLNDYEVADYDETTGLIRSFENAGKYSFFEKAENRLKLLVKESTKAPEDVKTFFKDAQSVDYITGTDNHIYFVINDLNPNTTYYCVGCFRDGLADTYGKPFSFTTKSAESSPNNDTSNTSSRSAIDLGLSVKWANMNLGATKVTDEGNTYELESTGKDIYQTKYDVAIKVWGQPWRMPTKEEAQELIDKCTWKFTSMSGVEGYQVTGPNKNSIFIPCTDDTYTYLWTGTYKSSGDYYYYYVGLDDNDRIRNVVNKGIYYRYYSNHYRIRAVQAK